MPKLTLLWVSEASSSFRTVSLSSRWVRCALVGCAALLITAVAGVAGTLWARLDAAALRDASFRVQAELERVSEELRLRETESAAARAETLRMEEELGRIQETESRIRRFLGLNEQSPDGEHSHQGGMGPGLRDELGGDRPESREPSPAGPPEGFQSRAQDLRSGLDEVVAHLEERRAEWRKQPMLLPAASDKVWLSCNFGWREDPFSGNRREFHNGIDVAGPWKSPVVAPADGVVVQTGKDRLFGVYVKLQHSDQVKTLYGHLASLDVKRGQKVRRGDQIGLMGNTGRSTGTHLHYSVSVNGQYRDPLDFVWDRPFRTLKL